MLAAWALAGWSVACASSGTSTPAPARRAVARLTGAATLAERGDPRLAAALQTVRAAPTAAAHRAAAEAYRRAGIVDLAHDHLQRSLALAPGDPRTHDALARLWRDWGQPARALAEAQQAVRRAPASAEARNTLGTVLWALGRDRDAAAAFEAALVRDPSAHYAATNLCAALQRAGRGTAHRAWCRDLPVSAEARRR